MATASSPRSRQADPGAPRPETLLAVSVFGGVSLSYGGREVALQSRKARAVLAYLALSETGTEQRERLAGLLWSDFSEQNARSSLRQALFDIREALGKVGCFALAAGRREVSLARGETRLDLTDMLADLESGHLPPALLQSRLAEMLLAGYEDVSPLLHDWLIVQRRAVHARLLAALERLYESPDRPRALRRQCAEAALQLDPLHEAACRAAMRLAAEDGETGAALRAYARLYDALGDELDMEPSAATRDLVVRIKQGEFDPGPTAALPHAAAPMAHAPAALRTPLSPAGAPTVAVLPFRSMGPDPVPGYFAEGVVEDTVCMLATLREPVVISSNSTRRFRDQQVSLRQIGEQLGVEYIVSGSIRMGGNRVRLAVELCEAANDTVLWGTTYDTDTPRLFEAQDDIAAGIARTLVPKLRDAEFRRSRGRRPEDLTAYHLMLQARDLIFGLERRSFEEAGDLLRRATALDPGYAPTHGALASWYSIRLGQGWSPDPGADQQALEAMSRAVIGLDPGNGRAIAMLAHNRMLQNRLYDDALRMFEQALGVSPNDAEALMWTSPTFAYIGEPNEAIRRAERAIALSPHDPFMFRYEHFLCIGHYAAGNYEEAVHWGLRSLRGGPHYTSNLRMTIAALAALGRSAEARPLVETVMRVLPNFRVAPLIAKQAFRDDAKRVQYGRHLVEAGLPA